MPHFNKISKSLLIFLCIIAASTLFFACRNSSLSQQTNTTKLVNWKVVFKPGTTEKDKAVSLLELDKYILDNLSKSEFSSIIPSIIIQHIKQSDKDAVLVQVSVGGLSTRSTDGVVFKLPPHPQPTLPTNNIISISENLGR